MMIEKLLTIIVPTYNMEGYLNKCLDSLIATEDHLAFLEVLIVNDGSKDSSSKIAHDYSSLFPDTFRVIDKENGNYGSCVNRGLKEAKGKFIKILDADDYFDKTVFNKFLEYLRDLNVDLIINDFCIVNERGAVNETYSFNLPVNSSFVLKDIQQPMVEWIWHHGITYRTEVLRSIDYKQTEGISYTDDEWIFMPMVAVKKISYFPYIMYYYLMGREGQTFDPKVLKTSFNKRVEVGKSMVKFFSLNQDGITEDANYYLTEKLKQRLLVIYNFYLIKHFSKDGNELLRSFDLYIKDTSEFIFTLLANGKDKLGNDNFIVIWRKANYKNSWYLKLKQLKFQMRLLFGEKYRNISMPNNLKRK